MFDKVSTEIELIDHLRIRYQVWANGIDSLSGILTGFSLARNFDMKNSFLPEFQLYLSKKFDYNPSAIAWLDIIKQQAGEKEYEISKFLELLDDFRNIDINELGKVGLTWEQRNFDFKRRLKSLNVDYPELPLKPPHQLLAVKIPNVNVHAFFYDGQENKYYEQCFKNFETLKHWAKECFAINEIDWGNKL